MFKPAQFRSPIPLGASDVNNLRFNELGATRIPGPTGTKVIPRPDHLGSGFILCAFNDDAATTTADGGALPQPVGTAPAQADPGPSAVAETPFVTLSTTERGMLWSVILEGCTFDQVMQLAQVLKGTNSALRLKSKYFGSEDEEGSPGAFKSLLDVSFENPMNTALTREVNALFEEYARLIWHEFFLIRKDLQESFKPGYAHTYYQLRHLYYKAGYSNPPAEINKINTKLTFLGNRIVGGVHPDLGAILKRAEARYYEIAPPASLQLGMAGFVPRPISDNAARLSNHAIGKAVDIDAGTNPQFSYGEANKIDDVLKWLKVQRDKGASWLPGNLEGPYLLSNRLTAAINVSGELQAYKEMQASSRWLQVFLQKWYRDRAIITHEGKASQKYLDELKRPHKKGAPPPDESGREAAESNVALHKNLELLIGALAKATPAVKPEQVIAIGLLNLPPQLVTALVEAFGQWGGEYEGKKDGMHFEVPSKGGKGKRKSR